MLVLNFKAHRHLLGSLYVQFHPQNLGLFSDVARYLGLCGTGPGHQVRLPFTLISGLDIWRLELIIDEVGMLDVGLDIAPEIAPWISGSRLWWLYEPQQLLLSLIVHRQILACYPLPGGGLSSALTPPPRLYLHFLT